MEHINTLKYFEELTAGGISVNEARTQTNALNSALDHLATKEDLNRVREDVQGVKDDLKDVKADIKDIKGDLRKMFYSMIVGILILLLKSNLNLAS